MRDFGRTLKIALRYRQTLAGILISSVVVALFWGANLGSIYPIVDVVLKGRSLQQWVDDNVQLAEENSAQIRAQIDELKAQGDGHPTTELAGLRRRLRAEQRSLGADDRCRRFCARAASATPPGS